MIEGLTQEVANYIEASMVALLAVDDVVQAERRLEEENAAEGDRSSAAEEEAERRRQERLDRQYEASERVEFFRRVHDAERRRWDRTR